MYVSNHISLSYTAIRKGMHFKRYQIFYIIKYNTL